MYRKCLEWLNKHPKSIYSILLQYFDVYWAVFFFYFLRNRRFFVFRVFYFSLSKKQWWKLAFFLFRNSMILLINMQSEIFSSKNLRFFSKIYGIFKNLRYFSPHLFLITVDFWKIYGKYRKKNTAQELTHGS